MKIKSIDMFLGLDFVQRRIEWFKELEKRAKFCDPEDGIIGFWKEHAGKKFKVKTDPAYYDFWTIFPEGKNSFNGTPYFNAMLTNAEVEFLEDTINLLSEVYNSLKPHFGKGLK